MLPVKTRLLNTIVLLGILALFLPIVANCQENNKLTPRQIAQQSLPSTVSVIMSNSTNSGETKLGSGFFVSDDIIVTNFHVIEGMTSGVIKVYGGEDIFKIIGTVGIDERNDLALLKIENVKGRRGLRLNSDDSTGIGDEVFAVGNPKGLEGTFSQGIVSSVRRSNDRTLLQITAPISHGSSGGAVLNERGEVVGVAVGAIEGGQSLNFAIPVLYLHSLVNKRSSLARLAADETVVRNDRIVRDGPRKPIASTLPKGPTVGQFGPTDLFENQLFGKVQSTTDTTYIPEQKFEKWDMGEPTSREVCQYNLSGYIEERQETYYSDRDTVSIVALLWINDKNQANDFPIRTRQLRYYDQQNHSLIIENYSKCGSCGEFELGTKFVTIYGVEQYSQFDPDGTLKWKTVWYTDSTGRKIKEGFSKDGSLRSREVEYRNRTGKIVEEWWRSDKWPAAKLLSTKNTVKLAGLIKETTTCAIKGSTCFDQYELRDPITNLVTKRVLSSGTTTTYEYEFDSQKNWIKQTEYEQVTKFGKTYLEPQKIIIRQIEYY